MYVGNIPNVTIPPLAKGLGGFVKGTNLYRYYGRFFLEDYSPRWLYKTLSY